MIQDNLNSLNKFKVGDVVTPHLKKWKDSLPLELEDRTFVVTQVLDNTRIRLDIDTTRGVNPQGRLSEYWQKTKNQVVKDIIADL